MNLETNTKAMFVTCETRRDQYGYTSPCNYATECAFVNPSFNARPSRVEIMPRPPLFSLMNNNPKVLNDRGPSEIKNLFLLRHCHCR